MVNFLGQYQVIYQVVLQTTDAVVVLGFVHDLIRDHLFVLLGIDETFNELVVLY